MGKAWGGIILIVAVALSGCSKHGLIRLRPEGKSPDEFMIAPVKPLTQPADYAQLPEPTPGGGNLVDVDPEAELVTVLGGNPSALVVQGVPASDSALVNHASRYGVAGNIRQTLSAEDAEFRRKQSRSLANIKLFPVDRYSQAYKTQALDAQSVVRQMRRRGIQTPSSPPE